MKNQNEIITEEGFVLRFYERPSTEFSISVPDDVVETLEKLAVERDTSVKALIRQYFGQGMRADLSENYPELEKELFWRRIRNRKNGSAKEPETEVDLAA